MPLTYMAQKRLKTTEGVREPGDLVPEASGWKNIEAYLRRGFLSVVNADDEDLEVSTEESGAAIPLDRVALEKLSYQQLQMQASAVGVKAIGKASKIIDRLLAV